MPQSGTITIPEESPLTQNPYTLTFTSSYSGTPKVSATVGGSTPKIVALDNVTTSGMDIWLFNTDGTLTSGTVYWFAEGV